jgi:hypothetical protein
MEFRLQATPGIAQEETSYGDAAEFPGHVDAGVLPE